MNSYLTMARRILFGGFLKSKFHRLPLPLLSSSSEKCCAVYFSTTRNIFASCNSEDDQQQLQSNNVSRTKSNCGAEDRLWKFIDFKAQQNLLCDRSNVFGKKIMNVSKMFTRTVTTDSHIRDNPVSAPADLKLEKDDKGRLIIYKGVLKNRFKIVKIFSLSTSVIGIAFQVSILERLEDTGLIVKIFTSVMISFFTIVTPILLTLLARRYVTDMLYEEDLDRYTSVTYTFFGRRKELSFKLDKVEAPEVPGPLSSILVKDDAGDQTPLFIASENFLDPIHYGRLMGFDKPLNLHLNVDADVQRVDKKR